VRTSFLLCAVLLGACAAAVAPKTASAPPANDSGAMPGDARGQIRSLDAHIDQQLASMGLDPPTDTDVTEAMVGHRSWAFPESTAIDTCATPPTGDQCGDVCTLADAICDDAKKICDLADELGGDAWATQKCESGKLSCEKSTQRCCECT